jgi:molecular chaperone GrpE
MSCDPKQDNVELDNNLDAVKEEMTLQEESEMEVLKRKFEEKEEESKEYFSSLQRLQADFANYKKRVEKEKSEIYLYASEKLILELLSIIDNLERALASQNNETQEDCIYIGVELVLKQLVETLKKHGVEEIDALGKGFDVNYHHAVAQEETEEEDNIVAEVFQKGYIMHGKLLRPSMVKVTVKKV